MTAVAAVVPPSEVSIPPLRQELRIEPGAPLVNGAPSWTLFDPIKHAFFQLGRIEFRIFSAWANGALDDIRDRLADDGLDAEEAGEAVGRVVEFSLANNLTVLPMRDTVASFNSARNAQRKAWWKWMMDNYLFFRLPLVRPAAFLERTLPRVAPIWSPLILWSFAILAAAGLILVSRQWDAFMASFLFFFSWQGLIAYGIGLSAVKVIHELGHAYTATRFGCRVPTMGVSFLVMMPVLYTDTTAAWRLTSRRQRLMIDCAGVAAELMVASVATMLWVMLPDGSLRSIAFITATSSWVMSLGINLNPFMRFDGYYILSDMLGVPNLQPRAFALGRWRMRELLFGLGEPVPEEMPDTLRRTLIVYAWATWLYRLVLFIGIALLVYHIFFKLLGIILFVVEMGVFVMRPVMAELKQWSERRDAILASRRGRIIIVGTAILLLLTLLPLDRHVTAPAVLSPIGAAPVVAGDPARVERVLVRNGDGVKAGTVLVELSAPDLISAAAQSRVRIAQLQAQLDRGGADEKDLSDRAVIERQLATETNALRGLERRQTRLVLRAPFAGEVADLEADIHPGRWLGGAETIARIVTPDSYDVQAFIAEDDVGRVADGALARFVPNDPLMASRPAKLLERSASAVQWMDQPILASTQGGPIAVDEDPSKALKPHEALYRIRLIAARGAGPMQPIAGEVRIEAEGQSLAGRFFGYIARILRSEASLTG
ncbi:putative peptide zinc metalloprotease protein [Sphingopyxis sp. YR583]|uniref:HlyD family efflux transporter periplasmic adaptor subunit n=1 Tax=Sphingopyxis sp. YR583 TaxID=1881047 RepID=UPI0008A76C0D|nr:HlyD family efflux transporter periplasmic adaptor subunit [Sphingopyxis sp. YR583]SEH17179.1 putative peptide zinc metalloprotease protein [Sphingopyxis sp. YR583]